MSGCSMHPNHRLPGNARLYVLFTEDEHTRVGVVGYLRALLRELKG